MHKDIIHTLDALQDRGEAVPPALKAAFAKRLLARVAEAYGRMLLLSGLFQVWCCPIDIRKGCI